MIIYIAVSFKIIKVSILLHCALTLIQMSTDLIKL